ncbi:putative aryl-alcohol dehydrogenase aad14 [Marasmius crinis-equi]|uniref:Aryl-alcohol dehydrogenase aad14 n=1 Tax=Marasmius crinis-equi TaxID=585013 RepID=A0ABR3FWI6_9AGAR
MSWSAPPPPPPTKLGVYRVLSSRAGAHVSPLCLGGMSIGDKWNAFMGSMDQEASFKLLDAYFDMGGNFIDTASHYQDETSEQFIGEWAEKRGIRDQLFIATKASCFFDIVVRVYLMSFVQYTTSFKRADPKVVQRVNYVGNNMKNMHLSVNASLKKLRTDYIDLLYVHWWDYDTSIEEVMDGLHNLVAQGKVLYLGISDTPAWIVAQANQYAKDHGKTPFSVYQGEWSIMQRSFERDIIPMARSFGMALAPWGVLAGGKLRSDAEEKRRLESGEEGRKLRGPWERNPEQVAMSRALEKVAKEVGAKNNTSVAIAYVMQKTTHVFPIIGGRKVEQLEQNLEALDITLTPEQIQFLEGQVPFDIGFPISFIGDGNQPSYLLNMGGHYQRIPYTRALGAPELPK